jgi:hypothetical protein
MKTMRSPYPITLGIALVCGVVTAPAGAQAQQVNVGGPFNNVGHGFYENIGSRWGVSGPGWFFNFGGGAPVAPPFGGFDPNAGAQMGGRFRAGNVNGFFNLNVGQGANSTFTSQTPSVTIPNGGNGIFIDGMFRPFVTSIIPVVGDNSDPSPLRERLRRLQAGEEISSTSPGEASARESMSSGGGGSGGSGQVSSADRGALSVAEIRAQAAAQEKAAAEEVLVFLEKARGAAAAGKPGVARIYYQMAARRAKGEQQREIQAEIETLPK